MKYKTVEIKRKLSKHKEVFTSWELLYGGLDNDEKEDTETSPNGLGFYHYKETMPDKEAAQRLKDCMVEAHQKEVDRLTRSINTLISLKI